MERLIFNRNHTPKSIVPIIGEILDNNYIPNVLVGDAMLGIMGAFIFPRCLQFVVPDDKIDVAITTLIAAGFPRCDDSRGCRRYSTHFPLATAHFHLWDDEEAGTTNPGKLCIFQKSDMLPSFPSLPFYISDCNDPYFMTITDDRLPDAPADEDLFGRYPMDTYPVRIPVPVKACEAAMLLYCRDQELQLNNAAWEVWLILLGKYVSQSSLYQIGRTVDKDGNEENPYLGYWNEVKGSQNRGWPRSLAKLRLKVLREQELSILAGVEIPEKEEDTEEDTEEEDQQESPVTPVRDYESFEKWVM
ncbi:hypothetical protein P170DRAFT_438236 [Aspergillus steynii IBT 23096]|uniref:Uncharacterized protein n=1 Tax=Aspergillus steynii IBT 23096 TaxID=1392250 RepID=A0A2I2G0N1_9EURO|nr:uncharacterized protein P170DRAFT_438236 [Aspergillus steynii IBT 23096]PLB46442.1 hypothetical protein P170DRAFT_438236 [Aspergillus steynii IBT 23096]